MKLSTQLSPAVPRAVPCKVTEGASPCTWSFPRYCRLCKDINVTQQEQLLGLSLEQTEANAIEFAFGQGRFGLMLEIKTWIRVLDTSLIPGIVKRAPAAHCVPVHLSAVSQHPSLAGCRAARMLQPLLPRAVSQVASWNR